MDFETIKQFILSKPIGETVVYAVIKAIPIYPSASQPKIDKLPKVLTITTSINHKGKKIMQIDNGFDAPKTNFFFDKDEAMAYAVKLQLKQYNKLKAELEYFENLTNIKYNYAKYSNLFPEVFI